MTRLDWATSTSRSARPASSGTGMMASDAALRIVRGPRRSYRLLSAQSAP